MVLVLTFNREGLTPRDLRSKDFQYHLNGLEDRREVTQGMTCWRSPLNIGLCLTPQDGHSTNRGAHHACNLGRGLRRRLLGIL